MNPISGLFVTGTDTGVGKTYVTTALIRELVRRGYSVQARKPVESGCEPSAQGLLPRDGISLWDATGRREPLERVCPIRLEAALSPPRAARLEGKRLKIADLSHACEHDRDAERVFLVEGAGGFYSPIAEDGLNADLAQCLSLPLLLVIADRLGCINHALLTIEAARGRGMRIAGLVLSQPQPSSNPEMDNLRDLEELTAIGAVGFPHSHDHGDPREAARALAQVLGL